MGRNPRYNDNHLYSAVFKVRPLGRIGWQRACEEYQKLSGETNIREVDDIKRHWKGNIWSKCVQK